MKMWGRRSFLRALGAAPLAGRAAAEAVAKEMGSIGGVGSSAGPPTPAGLGDAVCNAIPGSQTLGGSWWSGTAKREAMRSILANKDRDAEIRAILYRNFRRVHHIDPDIGGRRSWSLAAKIVYQRARFVDHEIQETIQENTSWNAVTQWVEDQLKNYLLR